ncbi:hypothetical protein [Saccharothrix syringae]|uniref:Uncharacterized protein n=1 Tax=Saccharothrix syringae TaxID=103733 RepID=A0A5Q0H1C4_SACSY|nr:hypothetical protein [Saccharothrix syringae]QFZ19903.1 hypothetical protein EKG83_22945 [Saccharothrix syringae]
MNDDIPDLPPWRAIPSPVRAQLRAEFDLGLDDPRPPRVRPSSSVVAAAAVVVLLVGAVIVLRDSAGTTEPAQRTTTAAPAPGDELVSAALDRCARRAARVGGYPDRSRWTPSFGVGGDALVVVAARAAGQPVFCQVTPTTVTVSAPAAGALVSREGVVAGTVDAPSGEVRVRGTGPHGDFGFTPSVIDHMYVAMTSTNPTGTRITADDVPVSAPDALTARDRPDGPEPDRASEGGRLLGECLRDASRPLVDPDSYQPGAHAGGIVLGRSATTLVVCRQEAEAGAARVLQTRRLVEGVPVDVVFAEAGPGGGLVVGGRAPAAAVRVAISVDRGTPFEGAAANSTYAVSMPFETRLVHLRTLVRLTAYDAAGTVLYDEEMPYALA